ncbi:hypothetical protein [Streptococcus ovuberis]|uniref:Uncharacterized protein n=1 Tax=Streptococcus ovuberis TaxID=1936207 RepID=A0A7X6S2N3_9STRE|nr:hypothetical protein [Streptococcus ovuberis]NKZ21436.1 hypothetical protein [Streptococcus ovuberis]
MEWGILAVIGLVGVYSLLTHQTSDSYLTEEDYDDRQRQIMGRSYKYGLVAILVLLFLYIVLASMYEDLFSVDFILMSLFFLSVAVVGVTNIVNGTYYPTKKGKEKQRLSPVQGIVSGLLIAGASLFLLFLEPNKDGLFQKGGNGGLAVLGLVGLALSLAFSYRLWKDKREVDE